MKEDNKLEGIITKYWKVSKIVGVLFTLCNYEMWINPFNIIKAIFILLGMSAMVFVCINIIDILIGTIKMTRFKIKRKRHEERLVDEFIHNNLEEK